MNSHQGWQGYVSYLESVWKRLCSLPPYEFEKKMNELSSPHFRQLLNSPKFLDSNEPVKYCYPTPRAYLKFVEMMEAQYDTK